MDIRWKKIENEFIEREKINAIFVFNTVKNYQRVRIVSSMDSRRAQQIAYELESDLHNIDAFQIYCERWYGDYGKYQHFTLT